MKKAIAFIVAGILISSTIVAQADTAKPATAKVYFIRETGFVGSLINFRAKINDSVVCKMSNKRYSIHDIAPGNYTFYLTTWDMPKNKKNGLDLEVEAGKTYYLRMVIKQKFFENIIYYQEITENSAAPLLAKCKLEENCGTD